MPSKFRVRYLFRPLVELLAKGLNKIGITANVATIIMLSFSILSFISLVFFMNLFYFGIFIFLCGIFDGIDGAIARLNNKSSQWGAFFDSTMDRMSEFVIFLALLLFCFEDLLWNLIDMKLVIFISFFCSLMISYSRARGENFLKKKKGDFDIGLMARSERLFYLFITSIIAFFFNFLNEFLFIFMWLVIGTAIFRFLKINKYIKELET
ncbi:MAG: CDP-alcohol phosphatidyltransferase family protein [Promethearchaeota archaeon]